jgi:hypothetical protein
MVGFGQWWSRNWRLLLTGLIWLAVVAVLRLGWTADHQEAVDRNPPTQAACAIGSADASKGKVVLTPVNDAAARFAFDRELTAQSRRVEYTVADADEVLKGVSCLNAEPGTFLRAEGNSQLDDDWIVTTARLIGDRVILDVTVDRRSPEAGDAGSYAGVVSLIDPRIERVDLPVQVTMAYPFWQLPWGVLLLLLLPATGYLWLLRGSFTGKASSELTLAEFSEYVFGRNGMLAIGSGLTAATGVLIASYLRSATWGGDLVEALTLFASMFTAFVAASATVSAAGSDRSGG